MRPLGLYAFANLRDIELAGTTRPRIADVQG